MNLVIIQYYDTMVFQRMVMWPLSGVENIMSTEPMNDQTKSYLQVLTHEL